MSPAHEKDTSYVTSTWEGY